MGSTIESIVGGGPLIFAVLVAALAGLISFLSPCVLPLIPGYLSYVTGVAGSDLDGPAPAAEGGVAVLARTRTRVLAGTALFVAGFTVVFVLMAILLTRLLTLVTQHRRMVDIVIGIIIVGFGLVFLGVVPGLQGELRFHRLPAAGLLGAPLLGGFFAVSWTPCVGPALGTVLGLAATGGETGRATVLAVAYCLGLGIPFMLFGLAYRRLLGVFRAVRRHSRWVTRIGGGLLIATGLVMILGGWPDLMIWLKVTFTFGTDLGTTV